MASNLFENLKAIFALDTDMATDEDFVRAKSDPQGECNEKDEEEEANAF